MRDLVKLKSDMLAYCEKKEKNGEKVAEYECPCCESKLKSVIPNEKGDVWDTAVTCYECGETIFIVKTIDGIVASKLD